MKTLTGKLLIKHSFVEVVEDKISGKLKLLNQMRGRKNAYIFTFP